MLRLWSLIALPAAALLLVGCGPSSLHDVSPKAFRYLGYSGQLGQIGLIANGCPSLDGSQVHATLGGRPLKMTASGSRATFDENKCDLPQWDETELTPPSEEQTVLEVSDDTETVRVTFYELTRPPAVALLSSASVARGQAVELQLSSGHLDDVITRVRFQPASGAEQTWPAQSIVQEANGTYSVPVPADAPLGAGELVLDVTSDIRVTCAGDVDCTNDELPIDHGNASTHPIVNLTTAPLPLTISG